MTCVELSDSFHEVVMCGRPDCLFQCLHVKISIVDVEKTL